MRPCIQLVCQGYKTNLVQSSGTSWEKKGDSSNTFACFLFFSHRKENALALAEVTANQEMVEDIYFFQYFICSSVPEKLFIGYCNHFQGNKQLT